MKKFLLTLLAGAVVVGVLSTVATSAPARWNHSGGREGATVAGGRIAGTFMSPTGNIRCRYFASSSTIGCLTRNNSIETMMSRFGQPYAQAVSHFFPAGRVLSYGRSLSFSGQFQCTSRDDGMFCRSLSSRRCFLTHRNDQRLSCDKGPGPIKEETLKGCHPSYIGACLNQPGDYDCRGGSGNGPNYTGPVRVIGYDEYDLDRDGDGYACEWS